MNDNYKEKQIASQTTFRLQDGEYLEKEEVGSESIIMSAAAGA